LIACFGLCCFGWLLSFWHVLKKTCVIKKEEQKKTLIKKQKQNKTKTNKQKQNKKTKTKTKTKKQ
jgi:hypothetical protein